MNYTSTVTLTGVRLIVVSAVYTPPGKRSLGALGTKRGNN